MNTPSAHRIAARHSAAQNKRASQIIQVTGSARYPYTDQVWDMFVKTYSSIGLNMSNPRELHDADVWELCMGGGDNEPVAFTIYKSTAYGLKSILFGSDGSAEGKSLSVKNLRAKFHVSGYYGEVSHKVEAIALAAGAPAVCSAYVPAILGKHIQPEPDGLHYTRSITGVGNVTKIMLGNPRGIPTTDPKNPSCPVAGRVAKYIVYEESGGMDKLAHFACLVDQSTID